MLKLNQETKDQLLDLYRNKRIALEGNILKLIDAGEDEEFKNYLNDAIEKDKETRRKRLDITKQVQSQNLDLVQWKEENERIQDELKESLASVQIAKEEAEQAKIDAETAREEAEDAREKAENARHTAENDLDMIQRKSQFELMGTIVKVALFVILGVGIVTTLIYIVALYTDRDTQIIGSTWSNMFGILLTNAFSIVGTIMGVKYASEKNKE
jgi:Fe2+ transport system protein B